MQNQTCMHVGDDSLLETEAGQVTLTLAEYAAQPIFISMHNRPQITEELRRLVLSQPDDSSSEEEDSDSEWTHASDDGSEQQFETDSEFSAAEDDDETDDSDADSDNTGGES